MNQKLKEKITESLSSVLPVTCIVLILGITITPIPLDPLMLFLAGAAFLIIGMGFFTLGVDMAMMPIGEKVGAQLARAKKLPVIVIACIIIGAMATVAEPDLQVLARQTPAGCGSRIRIRSFCPKRRWDRFPTFLWSPTAWAGIRPGILRPGSWWIPWSAVWDCTKATAR